jgi:hypothetical protein
VRKDDKETEGSCGDFFRVIAPTPVLVLPSIWSLVMHFYLEAILIFLFYFSNYCIHFYLNGPNCSCLSFFLPILSVALSHGHELARATSCPMRELHPMTRRPDPRPSSMCELVPRGRVGASSQELFNPTCNSSLRNPPWALASSQELSFPCSCVRPSEHPIPPCTGGRELVGAAV